MTSHCWPVIPPIEKPAQIVSLIWPISHKVGSAVLPYILGTRQKWMGTSSERPGQAMAEAYKRWDKMRRNGRIWTHCGKNLRIFPGNFFFTHSTIRFVGIGRVGHPLHPKFFFEKFAPPHTVGQNGLPQGNRLGEEHLNSVASLVFIGLPNFVVLEFPTQFVTTRCLLKAKTVIFPWPGHLGYFARRFRENVKNIMFAKMANFKA